MDNNKLLVLLLPIIIVIILFVTVFSRKNVNETAPITNFEECVAAGNPVMESYPRQCNTKDGKHFVEQIEKPTGGNNSGTPTPFAENWQTYTNQNLGISFPYPTDYELSENQATENLYYISIISPPDQDKPAKQTTLNENELKIEIVTEPSVENDSSEKCYFDHTEDPNILDQREIEVSGELVTQFDWQGLGTGQFACVIMGNTRYMINKYPLTTSLQNDYEIFLNNVLITNDER